MILSSRSRRLAAAVLLALLALGPLQPPARAQESSSPGSGDSVAGAIMAIGCGASARVASAYPHPIVVVVTVVMCAWSFVDAMASPDPF